MKKKLLSILLLIFLSMGLTGCKTSIIGGVSSIKITNSNDITLSIKEDTLTSTSATLILQNNSEETFHYGNVVSIEVKKNNKWHEINTTLHFRYPNISITPGETKEIEVNWKNSYGKLEKGTYRFIKTLFLGNVNDNNTLNITTEFNID